MIDNFAILFSTAAVVVTIYRAIRLDAERPWFKPWEEPGRPAKKGWRAASSIPSWRRR